MTTLIYTLLTFKQVCDNINNWNNISEKDKDNTKYSIIEQSGLYEFEQEKYDIVKNSILSIITKKYATTHIQTIFVIHDRYGMYETFYTTLDSYKRKIDCSSYYILLLLSFGIISGSILAYFSLK